MLRLIKGNDKPKKIVTCPVCDGVTFIDVRHTKHRTGNKISAGIKASACLTCIAKGTITLI